MEQVKKALSRAKTAFAKIQHRADLIEDDVSPGREIYEIDLALKELEDMNNPRGLTFHDSEEIPDMNQANAAIVNEAFHSWKKAFCESIVQWADWRLNQISNPAEAGEFLMDELENLKTLAKANINK